MEKNKDKSIQHDAIQRNNECNVQNFKRDGAIDEFGGPGRFVIRCMLCKNGAGLDGSERECHTASLGM